MMALIERSYQALKAQVNAFPDVSIVAVTKHQPLSKISFLAQLGHLDFAINYAQQGESVRKALSEPALRWHFIGHIQSRKAPALLGYDLVQSIDRLSVARAMNEKLQPQSRKLDVLVEVNIGRESHKSGVDPDEVESVLKNLAQLSNLSVRGLMAMPPFLEPAKERRRYFRAMRLLFERFKSDEFSVLSMGTSTDYAVAMQEGSTMIRLGTSLFGERLKS